MAYANHQALKWLKAAKRSREIPKKKLNNDKITLNSMISTGRTHPCLYEACVSIFKMRPASCLGLLPLDGAREDYKQFGPQEQNLFFWR